MNTLNWITKILVIVGALNWGLIAINSSWNLVEKLLGTWPIAVTIVYALVGLAGLWELIMLFKK
jgi:uncharacterized membrane protein YuzA (DUF378 family)